MRSTVPCPVCQHTLTVIANPAVLGCPFCRATIPNVNGRLPVGKRVRCRRCRGVFTAESPPPEIRIFASIPEACPVCQVVLAVRKDLPPGKKVKCGQCGTKFVPTRHVEAVLAKPSDSINEPAAAPPEPLPIPAVFKPASMTRLAPSKPASRTRLGPRQGSPRSSITHLAMDPLEETTPHEAAPTVPPLADDEVDLLGTDLGVDLEFPKETPLPLPEKTAPDVPAVSRVKEKQVSPDPSNGAPAISEARQDLAGARKSPHRSALRPENGVALPTVELRSKPDPVARRKKRRLAAPPAKAKQWMPAPVEIEPGDVEVMEEEPIVKPSAVQMEMLAPAAPKPLSYQSAEREAASALLADAPDEAEAQETDAAMPERAQGLAQAHSTPRSYAAPAAMPLPAPTIPRRPTSSDGPSITIDGKKVLQYTVPVLVVAALVVGILLIGRTSSRLSVYEVEGTVIFKGEVEGARVTLFPEFSKKHRYFPTGTVGKDGKFKLTTYKADDGAPAGHYKVKVVRGEMDMALWAKLNSEKTPEEVRQIADQMAQDPLIEKFSNPATSGLTADVVPGKINQIELRLD